MQYIVAIGLIFGRLLISDYEDDVAADPRIDALREKMTVIEDTRFTEGFFDPARRSSATGLQIRFKDGSSSPRVDVEYPVGHPTRREESAVIFENKFVAALRRFFAPAQCESIISMCEEQEKFENTPVETFMAAFVV